MILAPLFPLVPWFWSLLVLQLINGAAVSFAWSGAQTLIAQLALVPRVVQSAGYNLFSFTRASAVVNCQSALV